MVRELVLADKRRRPRVRGMGNPTCASSTYAGGLQCCGHKRILLDADQDPGPDLLRYHMKRRAASLFALVGGNRSF